MKKDPILELLPHKLNIVKKYRKVSPDDFDAELLMAAAREGRLYIDVSCDDVKEDILIDNVRAYVRRINPLVTPIFRVKIDDVWAEILACRDFVELLAPGPKAKKCREFNKYSVMRIICVLREKGVYEDLNDSKYNNLLEQTDKDTPYRKYLSMGLEQRHLMIKLRQIVAQYQL